MRCTGTAAGVCGAARDIPRLSLCGCERSAAHLGGGAGHEAGDGHAHGGSGARAAQACLARRRVRGRQRSARVRCRAQRVLRSADGRCSASTVLLSSRAACGYKEVHSCSRRRGCCECRVRPRLGQRAVDHVQRPEGGGKAARAEQVAQATGCLRAKHHSLLVSLAHRRPARAAHASQLGT
jgi:hypothetical protein